MIITILEYPDEVLFRECNVVLDINEHRSFIKDLKETLKYHKTGIGLAAPQVGKSLRIFCIKLREGVETFINPNIIKKSNRSITTKEGCLSCPGIVKPVVRSENILTSYTNSSGRAITKTFSGIYSVAFQHELDHLNGILLVDK